MSKWDIKITYEEETQLFFAEVLNSGNEPYYAQGKTEADTLSSLFGVIKACQEMDEELKESETTKNSPKNHHASFSVPVLS